MIPTHASLTLEEICETMRTGSPHWGFCHGCRGMEWHDADSHFWRCRRCEAEIDQAIAMRRAARVVA